MLLMAIFTVECEMMAAQGGERLVEAAKMRLVEAAKMQPARQLWPASKAEQEKGEAKRRPASKRWAGPARAWGWIWG